MTKIFNVLPFIAAALAFGHTQAFQPEQDLAFEPERDLQNLGCCTAEECQGAGEVCHGACCWGCWPIVLGQCAAPTPAPTPPALTPEICFSADATVQVKDKGRVAMKDLAVGDPVVTGDATNKYEPVYAFAHSMPDQKDEFIRISSAPATEEQPIELTPDHLIKVKGRFIKASSVRVGDTLEGCHHVPVKVEKVQTITKSGLFAPLTPSGTILVDGVVASSYVSMQGKGDEYPRFSNGMILPISQHFGIHMWLTPFRFLCMGVSASFCDMRNEEGMILWADWGIRLAHFADEQSLFIQFVMLVLVLVVVPPLYALECLVSAHYAPLVMLGATLTGVWMKKKTMVMGRVHHAKTAKKME